MIEQAAHHLFESTVIVALAGLLALAFRNNRAEVRYWLWLAASLKFLMPFAALIALGHQFGWLAPAPIVRLEPAVVTDTMVQTVSQPEAGAVAASMVSHPAVAALTVALLAIWAGGCALMLGTWCVRWLRIAAAVRRATPTTGGRELGILRRLEQRRGMMRPTALVASDSSLEPGVFGIVRPVLLWPRALGAHLGDAAVEAILAHELAHVRRRDNLAAAIHMVVQAVFWFHPLVWWVGARLVDERERACDEEVIRQGSEPEVYAESLLKTCALYLESQVVCMSGVSGSDLNKRIATIMRHDAGWPLSRWQRLLLAATGVATIAAPFTVGVLNAPRIRAQAAASATADPSFEVASIKPNRSGDGRVAMFGDLGGRFTATNVTPAMLIQQAYRLQGGRGGGPATSLLVGAPAWVYSDRFDIVARAEVSVGPANMSAMVKNLLIERFKLAAHTARREQPIYALVLARSGGRLGPQLRQSAIDCAALAGARGRGSAPGGDSGPRGAAREDARGGPGGPGPLALGERPPCGMRVGPGNLVAGGATIVQLASTLTSFVDRIVLDRTGLIGGFDVDLQWTPELPAPGRGEFPPAAVPGSDANGPSIFTALQEQLGLKLDSTKGQVDVLVIDHVEQPSED